MKNKLIKLLAIFSIATLSIPAIASGLESLQDFIKTTRSGRALFTQVVTSPAQPDQVAKVKTSSGRFEFLRPGRFKFTYNKPFEQSIVADGQTLWVHDLDLNQVTSRKQAQALSGAPASLITAAADLKSLSVEFNLKEQPERAGLQWVLATPKAKDTQLQSVHVGLRPGNRSTGRVTELAVLEIVDGFGQRSVMTFTQFESNSVFGAEHFAFVPPTGASVSRQ